MLSRARPLVTRSQQQHRRPWMTGGARRLLSAESHDAHHVEVMNEWRQRTMYALPVLGVIALVNVYVHMSHGHHEHDDVPMFSYQRKLVKKYPWSPEECNLFDYDCKAKHAAAAHGGIVKSGGH